MKRVLVLAVLTAAASVSAFAVGDTCTGGVTEFTDTLTSANQLLTGGTSCLMGAFTFSNFDVYTQSGYQVGETVQLVVQTDDPGAGILSLSVACTSDCPSGSGDYIFTYTVSPGPTNMVLYAGTAASIEQNICAAATGFLGGGYGNTTQCASTTLGSLSVGTGGSDGPVSVTASGTDYVAQDVDGGSENYQELGLVPEPMSLSLMGAGLLGLGFLRRRNKR